MPISGSELFHAFHFAYPDDFLGELLFLISTEYKTAHQECRSFYPDEEAHDLWPHVRRAKIDAHIRALAQGYPITASAEPNKTRTNYHSRLVSGNVVLTIHAVRSPNSVVRRAVHRKTYARSSQLELFEIESPQPPPDAALYVNLIHGGAVKHPQIPAFMVIGFPDNECKSYLFKVDLLKLPQFRSIAESLTITTKPETIEDDLNLNFRKDARNKKRKEEDEE